MTSEAEYQLVTLKRAIGRNGVVCRVRTADGAVRVDVYWSLPRVRRNMRPFISEVPLALFRDLSGNGFEYIGAADSAPINGLFAAGILWVSFASDQDNAEQLARSIIASHGLAKSDRVVAWAIVRAKESLPAFALRRSRRLRPRRPVALPSDLGARRAATSNGHGRYAGTDTPSAPTGSQDRALPDPARA